MPRLQRQPLQMPAPQEQKQINGLVAKIEAKTGLHISAIAIVGPASGCEDRHLAEVPAPQLSRPRPRKPARPGRCKITTGFPDGLEDWVLYCLLYFVHEAIAKFNNFGCHHGATVRLIRIAIEVLLVVILGQVEHRRRRNLGHNRIVP